MSKINFQTICGAIVDVDVNKIKSIHFPCGDNYVLTDRGIECGTGQIVLDCGSHFAVDADTFWQIAKVVGEARVSEINLG